MSADDSAAVLAVQIANVDKKLDAIHASQKEDVGEIKEQLRDVQLQTRLTNGRVSGHDKKLAELRGAYIAFGAASPFLVAAVAVGLSRLLGS